MSIEAFLARLVSELWTSLNLKDGGSVHITSHLYRIAVKVGKYGYFVERWFYLNDPRILADHATGLILYEVSVFEREFKALTENQRSFFKGEHNGNID